MAEGTVDQGKRRFLIGATSVVGGVGVVAAATPFVMSFFPSERAKAAGAPVEVDIGKIEPGQKIDVEWRGKVVLDHQPHASRCSTSLPKLDPRLADPEFRTRRSSRRTARTSTARSRTAMWSRSASARTSAARRRSARKSRPPTSGPTGSAASSARATSRSSTSRAASIQGVPAPTNLRRSRRTSTCPTPGSSSATDGKSA